jgi:hypothetical protein
MDDDGALFGVEDADLVKIAGVVGSDQHGETVVEILSPDRVVERVKVTASSTPWRWALGATTGTSTTQRYRPADRKAS